jgi:hypothetical protein
VLRVGDQTLGWTGLDDAPEVHDHRSVTDVSDDCHVVGNKQEREAELFSQISEQIENRRLDRHIQGRDRLIRNQQLRLYRQGPCNADALTLTARQLSGIGVGHARAESHQVQELRAPALGVLTRDGVMNVKRFHQRLLNRHSRIQRRVRVLKDDLGDSRVGVALSLARGHGSTVQAHLAGGTFVEANDASAECGFSAAGFSDQSNRLTTRDREVDSIDRSDRLGLLSSHGGEARALQGKVHLEPAYLENGRGRFTLFKNGCC